MTTTELKQKLINQIQKMENKPILEEALRLLELESKDLEVYKLNEDQKSAVAEARQQYQKGDFLNEGEADQEIDEWLSG